MNLDFEKTQGLSLIFDDGDIDWWLSEDAMIARNTLKKWRGHDDKPK